MKSKEGAFLPVSDSSLQYRSSSPRLPDVLPAEQWTALSHELKLSAREADILRSACYDDRTEAIAKRLGLAPSTVHTYRDRLYRKLGVRSLASALGLAFAVFLVLRERAEK